MKILRSIETLLRYEKRISISRLVKTTGYSYFVVCEVLKQNRKFIKFDKQNKIISLSICGKLDEDFNNGLLYKIIHNKRGGYYLFCKNEELLSKLEKQDGRVIRNDFNIDNILSAGLKCYNYLASNSNIDDFWIEDVSSIPNTTITPEVEQQLAKIAVNNAHLVNDEYGLLYLKLKKWYENYGNYPSAVKLKSIILRLKYDELRSKTKIRNRDGKEVGGGAGIRLVSLFDYLSDDLQQIDVLDDRNATIPNEREYFNENLLTSELTEKEKKLVNSIFLNGRTQKSVAIEFGVTESRISQIKTSLSRKIQERYKTLSTATNFS